MCSRLRSPTRWPRSSLRRKSSGCCRAAWSSDRARSAADLRDAAPPAKPVVNDLKNQFPRFVRPIAPAVLREQVHDRFHLDRDNPDMLLVADLAAKRPLPVPPGTASLWGIEKLNVPRS